MIARSRIESRFASLKRQERAGLVTFITAGDPDLGTSMELLRRLPLAGADIIELGMPFSDPMADGPAIQASSLRALKAGQTMRRTLDMVAAFRRQDGETPLILMGYFNPVCSYGINRFVTDARTAGVDGLIIVDLPPEEADELLIPARQAGLHIVFLAAPTTDERRLTRVLGSAQGFLYYVSITGITGAGSAARNDIAAAISRIREQTSLPIAVGFGIRTPEQVRQIAPIADGVVVGSAIVDIIAKHANGGHALRETMVDSVTGFVGQLSNALRTAPARERS